MVQLLARRFHGQIIVQLLRVTESATAVQPITKAPATCVGTGAAHDWLETCCSAVGDEIMEKFEFCAPRLLHHHVRVQRQRWILLKANAGASDS